MTVIPNNIEQLLSKEYFQLLVENYSSLETLREEIEMILNMNVEDTNNIIKIERQTSFVLNMLCTKNHKDTGNNHKETDNNHNDPDNDDKDPEDENDNNDPEHDDNDPEFIDLRTIALRLLDAQNNFNLAVKNFFTAISQISYGQTYMISIDIPVGINSLNTLSQLNPNNTKRILKRIIDRKKLTRLDLLRLYHDLILVNQYYTYTILGIYHYTSCAVHKPKMKPKSTIHFKVPDSEENRYYNHHFAGAEEALQQEEAALEDLYSALYKIKDANLKAIEANVIAAIDVSPIRLVDRIYYSYLKIIYKL